MSLYQVLKKEHKAVKDLMARIVSEGEGMPGSRDSMFVQLQQQLELHMDGEEQFFYPVLEHNDSSRDEVLEAYEEHHVARLVLNELSSGSKESDRWRAKMKVFQEILEHHIKEEEHAIFGKARELLDRDREQEILNRYEQLKQGSTALVH